MNFDFDRVIERRGTDSAKYDGAAANGVPETALPLWVADMDFTAPPAVLEALQKRVAHGIFGYGVPSAGYFPAVADWHQTRHHWRPEEAWLIPMPGVVFAFNACIRAYSEPGDAVLIQPPVYHPFFFAVENNQRVLVTNPLVERDGRYTVDLEAFERQIIEQRVKVFLFCSPHNPVGRVWQEQELLAMGRICKKHGVVVIADEIHADFVFPGYRHQVFAALEDFAAFTITCTAPSKTFNLAGLQAANLFVSDPVLRNHLQQEMEALGYHGLNVLGAVACEAAYRTGAAWLDALLVYLRGNLDYLRDFLAQNLPQVRLVEPEGTYLLWLDFRALGMDNNDLHKFLIEEAGLWLNVGGIFGKEGQGFARFNIGCPRSVLVQAMEQLQQALAALA